MEARALMCSVYVNEIATVEHFAPGRKKCSVYAHILLATYMNGAIPTRALPRLASACVGETALRGLNTYNIGLIKVKSMVTRGLLFQRKEIISQYIRARICERIILYLLTRIFNKKII